MTFTVDITDGVRRKTRDFPAKEYKIALGRALEWAAEVTKEQGIEWRVLRIES